MPPTITQTGRPLAVRTPLGPDALLLVALNGQEALSQPFHYDLELLAENHTPIPFEGILGKGVTVELLLPSGAMRFYHGIVSRFNQSHNDGDFTHYRAEVVPEFWLLTKRHRSHIFQHLSVPDILKQVLQGLDVRYQIHGLFHPREFCAQYRESDFAFASRLMEEEGIYYFFEHAATGHQMVLANTPTGHPDVSEQSLVSFDHASGGLREDDRVTSWQKVQEVRSSKYQLRDHNFELPHQHLEAEKSIQDSVPVGRVSHLLNVSGNGTLDVYDYPGGYAHRFDGIDRGGAERPVKLPKIFEDNQRTVNIRMAEEATPSLTIHGISTCRQFMAGHKFTLQEHGHGDGPYVLTQVKHAARQAGFTSAEEGTGFSYQNAFTCIPLALPFRPPRQTPKPLIHGTQSATVVGPAGEEIFLDKYGRVKVQFRWDREGKNDADSSCWVRAAQAWAGKTYGAHFWPRVGHEVVVAFEEGDPDKPIIIGSVYNAENVTPYDPRESKTSSGVVTQSTPGGSTDEYNELFFDDTKGEELVYMRAQKNFSREVLHDDHLLVGNEQVIDIVNQRKTTVRKGNDELVLEDGDEMHQIDGSYVLTAEEKASLGARKEINLTAGDGEPNFSELKMTGTEIRLAVGGSSITMTPDGIRIVAPKLEITAANLVNVKAGGAIINMAGSLILNQSSLIGNVAMSGISNTTSGVFKVTAGGMVKLAAPQVKLDSPLTKAAGVVKCETMITNAVVSPSYTSGAGNLL